MTVAVLGDHLGPCVVRIHGPDVEPEAGLLADPNEAHVLLQRPLVVHVHHDPYPRNGARQAPLLQKPPMMVPGPLRTAPISLGVIDATL